MDNKQHNAPKGSSDNLRDDGSARSRLLEVSTRLFAENGLDGTSTRDIAKAADLNISLISYYFGGKEGLYKTVLTEFGDTMQKETSQVLAGLDLHSLNRESFQKVMRSLIKQMLPLKHSHRDIHTILHREMMAGLPHAKDVYENVFSRILETIVEIYIRGQKKGFIRKEINPYILFFSMVHSADTFMQMSGCPVQMKLKDHKILKLPEQLEEYGEQLYMIFVEGVML